MCTKIRIIYKQENPGGTIYNRIRQCLAYADDIVILGRSEEYIKKTLEEMVAITQQIGLQMNDTKTKFMLNRQVGNKVKEIELMGRKYEKVESFKYLGAMITSLNDIETEINPWATNVIYIWSTHS